MARSTAQPGGQGQGDAAGGRLEKLVETRLDERGTRRSFLKIAGAAAGSRRGGIRRRGAGNGAPTSEEFFRQHYKKLTDEDKKRIFARIEEETLARTGVRTHMSDSPPIDGVEFAYALNLSVCNGSRRCVEACARENNLPDDPEIRYIRVMEMEAGSLEFEEPTPNYDHEKVPEKGKFYLPVQCHQCDNPLASGPARSAPRGRSPTASWSWTTAGASAAASASWPARTSPAASTWRAAMAPRRSTPTRGTSPTDPASKGVVEKCTLLSAPHPQRAACLRASRRAPPGARKFGNLHDPNSEIRKIIETKRVFVLKEELGDAPRFYYFFA